MRIGLIAIALLSIAMDLCAQKARVFWEGGFKDTSGRAVISTHGDWAADGIPQLYHHWKSQLEAVADWRSGDLLESRAGDLCYTLKADSSDPVRIEFRLSHVLGSGNLEFVESQGPWVVPGVSIRHEEASPHPLDFEIQPFQNGRGLSPDELNEERSEERLAITHKAEPNTGRVPAWDRLVISIRRASGVIPNGTSFRISVGGVPFEKSSHEIPATSDPLDVAIVYDQDAPLSFWATGIHLTNPNEAKLELRWDRSKALVEAGDIQLSDDPSTIGFGLQWNSKRQVPSLSFVNLLMSNEGYVNLQPTAVLNFKEYSSQPLKALLKDAWSRMPQWPAGAKPNGRPLWESSVALADKAASHHQGLKLDSPKGTFTAMHVNQRRVLLGSVSSNPNSHFPAIWMQRHEAPVRLGDQKGELLGGNDRITSDFVGYQVRDGIERPTLWSTGDGKDYVALGLPMKRGVIGGRALDMNDSGVICGYVEAFNSGEKHRVPTVWRPNEEGEYEMAEVLPVPEAAVNGCAIAINRRGMAVGYYSTSNTNPLACYWGPFGTNHHFVDLKTHGAVRGINDLGMMVGGTDKRSYLWQSGHRHELNKIKGAPEECNALGISHTGDVILIDDNGNSIVLKPQTALTAKN